MDLLRTVVAAGLLSFPLQLLADGNELLAQCTDAEHFLNTREVRDAVSIGTCIGMVQGVQNTMIYLNRSIDKSLRLCWPEQGINNGPAVRILVQYLRNNPEKLHEDEVLLAMLAFNKAYSCR